MTQKTSFVLAFGLVAALGAASAAEAQTRTIDRSGPYGGSVVGEVTRDGRVVTRDVTRTAPNGATLERSSTCARGVVRAGCRSGSTFTNRNGDVYTSQSARARGPFRAGAARTVTGPNGGQRSWARGVGPRGGFTARRWRR